ncbi:MAG: 2-hydroxyacid dehydrogenase [Candidatus Jordarchaeum sp.]|uniref:2-hydroxyacid dehydrogenase n=1 Tax=Candidatus Jordarchaeum sp. TaxID=2823881 RepID=UPI00404B664F
MKKVYITRQIAEEALKLLRENANVTVHSGTLPPKKNEIIKNIRDAHGLVALLTDQIDAEIIDHGKQLTIIANVAVGYDNIDLEAATRKGIYVTNTPGVLDDATADLAFTILLAVARRIPEADSFVRSGQWKGWSPNLLLGSDLRDKTLGIIGLGRIGSEVAKRAKCFKMKIVYYQPQRDLEKETNIGVRYVSLEELLSISDFVSLHVPLTSETRSMISRRELNKMKKTAYLINTSRGQVVDEEALYEALTEGEIKGAALDVYDKEPISPDNPLLKLKNIVLTPHIGSATLETRTRMAVLAAENTVKALKNEIPSCIVNPQVLEHRKNKT